MSENKSNSQASAPDLLEAARALVREVAEDLPTDDLDSWYTNSRDAGLWFLAKFTNYFSNRVALASTPPPEAAPAADVPPGHDEECMRWWGFACSCPYGKAQRAISASPARKEADHG